MDLCGEDSKCITYPFCKEVYVGTVNSGELLRALLLNFSPATVSSISPEQKVLQIVK